VRETKLWLPKGLKCIVQSPQWFGLPSKPKPIQLTRIQKRPTHKPRFRPQRLDSSMSETLAILNSKRSPLSSLFKLSLLFSLYPHTKHAQRLKNRSRERDRQRWQLISAWWIRLISSADLRFSLGLTPLFSSISPKSKK